jgi:phage major head subunit gpT-like protein
MAFSPAVIEKGLTAGFAKAMAEFQAARSVNPGIVDALAKKIASTSAYEKLGWVGAVPAVQEWLGELSEKDLDNFSFTVRNKNWVAGVPISQDDLDDDQYGVLADLPATLVQRIMVHPEELIINLINALTTTLAYDGVNFVSDASGVRTNDNKLAGTGTTLAQLEADLNQALVTMAGFTDNQSKILNVKGNVIVCPMVLANKFRRLVYSQNDPTVTSQLTYNPYQGNFTVIGDARLDAVDVNDWYLFATGELVKPFLFSLRQEGRPMWEKKNLTKTWVASANYRGNVAVGIPQLAIQTIN